RQRNLICSAVFGPAGLEAINVVEQPIPSIRPDLLDLFDREELAKYLTASELPVAAADTDGDSS
ncbi:MAG: hypothetical protein QOE89_3637, partial [Pseudonocardiales bacterium]|nr:hypothetical protein [Pseudonocardiales bacterium]